MQGKDNTFKGDFRPTNLHLLPQNAYPYTANPATFAEMVDMIKNNLSPWDNTGPSQQQVTRLRTELVFEKILVKLLMQLLEPILTTIFDCSQFHCERLIRRTWTDLLQVLLTTLEIGGKSQTSHPLQEVWRKVKQKPQNPKTPKPQNPNL